MVVFDVDAKLHSEIMANAVPQRPIPGVNRDPSAPKIVKEKGTDLFMLELKGILNKSVPFRSVPFCSQQNWTHRW